MVVQVEVRGLDEAIFRINEFQRIDRFGLLSILAETVRKQTLTRFNTKMSPTGGAWAPRKSSSRSSRRGGRLLVDTGRLRNSISSVVTGSTARIGTNVFYAKFHQEGTRKMVARPFLGINQQDLSELTRITESFIAAATR